LLSHSSSRMLLIDMFSDILLNLVLRALLKDFITLKYYYSYTSKNVFQFFICIE